MYTNYTCKSIVYTKYIVSHIIFHPTAVSLGRSSVAGSNASKRTKILLKKKNLVLALVVSIYIIVYVRMYVQYIHMYTCTYACM